MKEKNNIEKAAAEKQVGLLSSALGNAATNYRYWLNAAGKQYPRLYPKGVAVSQFNAIMLALHSDRNGSVTNLYTTFSEAKKQGYAVREHEKGVPFLFYNWDKYVNRNNPQDVISRSDYQALDDATKSQYKGIQNREVRTLFNVDQTLLPMVDKETYDKLIDNYGGEQFRAKSDEKEKALHVRVNDFIEAMRKNLVSIERDGTGVAHYDSGKDVVYLPQASEYEHYNDYVQDAMRQVVTATGHQQRLAREGMVMENGSISSYDAVKYERLVTEMAAGVKMAELGLPARLSKESLAMTDYWQRELKENPCLIDALEADVNNALKVIHKAEQGEKVEYATMRRQRETAQMQSEQPKHYYIADEIRKHPNVDDKTVVIVRDAKSKTADVILPQGASLEVNNEIKGMSKQRYTKALETEGFSTVNFHNPDGALGFCPDDSYFADKTVTVSRLKNWSLENLSTLDVSEAVAHSKERGFDMVQMLKDDKNQWALYIKPEGRDGFAVYPDKGDLNQFFTTVKQSLDNIDSIRSELAQKYFAMAENKPELKVDLFGNDNPEVDLNKIQRVSVFKAKSGPILCAATIDGQKMQPRSVSPSQWQRMWIAPDRDAYKKSLAAALFADVLRQDNGQEQTAKEKEEEHVEQKQNEQPTMKEEKHESKQEEKQQSEPVIKQFLDLKKKHPDALLLFRIGDFYETYKQDAVKSSEILGITLTRSSTRKDDEGKPLQMAGFPFHALDTYLPKLVRAGQRVAICEAMETPRQQAKQEQNQSEQRSAGLKR